MATEKTKQQLMDTFVDGYLVRGSDFSDLIYSLKGNQTPVSDPSVYNNQKSTSFISNISQNKNGDITVTKKNVDFSGYQTTAGMAGYQDLDLQRVGDVTVGAGESQTINHNMKHYPTVRLMDAETMTEIDRSLFTVQHTSNEKLILTLGAELDGTYKYILD